jgi:hypothetical protein
MADTKKKPRQRPPRKERPKQTFIPGTEPPSFPDIDEAVDSYVDRRDERMELLQQEIKARDVLLLRMKDRGLKEYRVNGKVVTVTADTTEKVSVKVAKEKADVDTDADE